MHDLHVADLRALTAQARDLSEYAAIIADVNNDAEYNAITCLVDDLEQFCDAIDSLPSMQDARGSAGVM